LYIFIGIIQGDPLSPFLWNIFMDSLLRWLEVGGRRYKFSTSYELVAFTVYVDRLKTHTRGDARCQMAKVARFADWSGLKVNLKKCAFTALRAGFAAPEQSPLPFGPDLGPLWLPPSSPYRYLGVELIATLGWKADIDDCMASAAEKVNAIASSQYSPLQKLTLLNEIVVTAAAYKLSAGDFTPSSVAKFDKHIASWARQILGVSQGTAGAFVFLPRDLHGWGVKLVRKMLSTTYTNILLQSLRDNDRLGRVTMGLVQEHLKRGYDGSRLGIRLYPAYGCTLPTANMMRALEDANCGLDGPNIGVPNGAGGLLRLFTDGPERPNNSSRGPLETLSMAFRVLLPCGRYAPGHTCRSCIGKATVAPESLGGAAAPCEKVRSSARAPSRDDVGRSHQTSRRQLREF
jgi:hypothetical protein